MSEATMHGIEFGSEFAAGSIEHLKRYGARRKYAPLTTKRSTATLFEIIGELIGLLFYFFMMVMVIICYCAQDTSEARHDLLSISTIIRGERGASIEQAPVGHRTGGPASTPLS